MSRTTSLAAAALLLGSLGLAGVASADDTPPPSPGTMGGPMHPGIDFKAIDTNHDGSLSKAELTTFATARLSQADSNKDGVLDRTEIIAASPAPRGGLLMVFAPSPAEASADRLLALMGATDSGQIQITALVDRQVNALLAFVDTDHDGAITQAEANAAAWHRNGGMHGHMQRQ